MPRLRPLRKLIDLFKRRDNDDPINPFNPQPRRRPVIDFLGLLLGRGGGLLGSLLLGGLGLIKSSVRAYLISSPAFWLIVATVLGLLALVIFGG